MWFSCKACKQHEAHIASLKAQIEDLRRFAIPTNTKEPTLPELEADGILSAQQHIIEIPDTEADDVEMLKILSERDQLLSGSFN